MNKNVLLGAVAALALVIVGALLFFSPNESVKPMESASKVQQPKTKQNVDVVYHEKSQKKSVHTKKQSLKKAKKKVNPTIKAAAVDHYHRRYLIQLIDKSQSNEELEKKNKSDIYIYVEGKINGKNYRLKIPRNVVTRPGIKLKVTDLKTKKSTELDASFLAEAETLPKNAIFKANISTYNPKRIQTGVEMLDSVSAFPPVRD